MAIHSSQVALRAKWHRGWALMRAGKTTEGYDLLSGIKLIDLRTVNGPEHPNESPYVFKRSSSDSPAVRQTRATP
jgi:hypothetical protein